MLRGLCALEIAGVHWLRACMHVNLFSNTSLPESFRNFIWSYKNNNVGFHMLQDFPNYLNLDNQNDLAAALNNTLGFLFGFGWEAVNVFIFISGFSLTLKLTNWPDDARLYWFGWYKRRLRRIFLPYYLIVAILVSSFLFFYLAINLLNLPFLAPIQTKIQERITQNWLDLLVSNIFLFNPWKAHGSATFFTSAWWFIPAIVVTYMAFPLYFWSLTKLGSKLFLISTFLVTTISYWLGTQNILGENSWYYIILFESFNLSLGMVIGRWYQSEAGRVRSNDILFNPITLLVGISLIIIGNGMNWFAFFYPFSSIFFTSGLIIVGSNLSKWLLKVSFARRLKDVDFYVLYLIHQPFSYITALTVSYLLKRYAAFLGVFIYLFIVLSVTYIFSSLTKLVERKVTMWTQNYRIPNNN
jgi:peptidoglycan/LPS O-acetylase OafA/YrhL